MGNRHSIWHSLTYVWYIFFPLGWDITLRALTLLRNISSIVHYTRAKSNSLLCISHSIQSPFSSVLLHSELHEGSEHHLSFLNNAICWGVSQSPLRCCNPANGIRHSSQHGSMDNSYAYSNRVRVVNAVTLHGSGCWMKCQLCCMAKEGRILQTPACQREAACCTNFPIILLFLGALCLPNKQNCRWRNE